MASALTAGQAAIDAGLKALVQMATVNNVPPPAEVTAYASPPAATSVVPTPQPTPLYKAILQNAKYTAMTAGVAAKTTLERIEDYDATGVASGTGNQQALYALAKAAASTIRDPASGFVKQIADIITAGIFDATEADKASAIALAAVAQTALTRAFAAITANASAANEFTNLATPLPAAPPTLGTPPTITELYQSAAYYAAKTREVTVSATPLNLATTILSAHQARATAAAARAYVTAGVKASPAGGGVAADIDAAILSAVQAALAATDATIAETQADAAESKANELNVQFGGARRRYNPRRTHKRRNHVTQQ